jgi:hypothetical protein
LNWIRSLNKVGAVAAKTWARVRPWAGPTLSTLRGRLAALQRFLAKARTRKILKIGALVALGLAVFLGLSFFAFRNAVLRSVLDGKLRSYERRNPGAVVTVGKAGFGGLSRIDLEGVRLRSADGALAVDLGHGSVAISFWKMLLGQVRLKRLALSGLQVDLRPGAAAAAMPAPARTPGGEAHAKPAATPGRMPDYAARVALLLDLFFNRIPDSVEIDGLTLHTDIDDVRQAFYVPRLAFHGPAFDTEVEVFAQGRKWACRFAGEIDRGKKRLALRLLPPRKGEAPALPFCEPQWGLKVGFDSLAVGLQSRGRQDGVLRLEGSLAVSALALNHPRIAAENVNIENAAVDFALRVGPDFVELVAPTRVAFNRLAFQPTVKLVARPTRQVFLKIPLTRFAADALFASLPEGLFTRLAGIRTSGELAFHLDFAIDLGRPEELELDVDLEKSGFRIQRFGKVDFRAVHSPFPYTAYEKDRALRTFIVGPENPEFRPLDRIPAFLENAVMISEDGAFFSHRGFLLEPFKNSIVANLRAGRFVRGASTISMQLAKNLYLRRHKTIARKLEEMLITWLVEENGLVSKERMLEIYLNIIEWGPEIYGAQEAARFYFDKDVEELTLAEAIFMASIIPRPKRFMYFFDENLRLRPWLQAYYADVSEKMLARGWISQYDFDTLLPEVELRGPAMLLLRTNEAPPALEPLDEELPDRP